MQPPAGFWRRYAAYSLDAAAIGVLSLPLLWSPLARATTLLAAAADQLLDQLWPLLDRYASQPGTVSLADLATEATPALQAAASPLSGPFGAVALQCIGIVLAVAAIWFIASESSRWQASPGKRWLGLRVTDVHGGRCGPGRIVARFFAGVPSWLLLNFGHALAGMTPSKRALHDYIAGTRVELAPGASPAMPRAARSWLLLQVAVFFGLLGVVLTRYVELVWVITSGV